jgi:hypothetical protein
VQRVQLVTFLSDRLLLLLLELINSQNSCFFGNNLLRNPRFITTPITPGCIGSILHITRPGVVNWAVFPFSASNTASNME